MADGNSSDAQTAEECLPSNDYQLFNQISMAPAALIIIVLMFSKRRSKKLLTFWDGRPALLPPVDFLGSEENRFSYAMAYGAMAVSVTNLFLSSLEGKKGGLVVNIQGSPWLSAFHGILSVILLGIIYLPFFVCLSTGAKLLGSLFGFLYAGFRFASIMLVLLRCPIISASVFPTWPIFFDLPVLLFHVFLIARYAFIFVTEASKSWRNHSSWASTCLGEEEDKILAPEAHKAHVKGLLTDPDRRAASPKLRALHIKVRDFVYVPPRADFKYPVPMLATVLVAGVIIYEMVILIAGEFIGRLIHMRDMIESNKEFIIYTQGEAFYGETTKFLRISIGCLLASTVVAALISYFQMYRVLKAHRHHVLKMFRSERKFLPGSMPTPTALVGLSLRFCGYQIAHFIWGFFIMLGVLLILTVGISFLVLILPELLSPQNRDLIVGLILGFLPVILVAILLWLFQKLLALFVFADRSIKSKVVHIDNRRVYLVVTFFFLFLNVVVGLLSCALRILKGMVFGIFLIGRIDRPLLMKGFQSFDTAYMSYVGFLHVQVAHKHPVVLVFCQLLWNKVLEKRDESSVGRFVPAYGQGRFNGGVDTDIELGQINSKKESRVPGQPRVSKWALNKWFLAITMIRNPTLIPNRKGFFAHVIMASAGSAKEPNETESQGEKALLPKVETV